MGNPQALPGTALQPPPLPSPVTLKRCSHLGLTEPHGPAHLEGRDEALHAAFVELAAADLEEGWGQMRCGAVRRWSHEWHESARIAWDDAGPEICDIREISGSSGKINGQGFLRPPMGRFDQRTDHFAADGMTQSVVVEPLPELILASTSESMTVPNRGGEGSRATSYSTA
jgi:hypothetical protein